jgi:hypothetical protein
LGYITKHTFLCEYKASTSRRKKSEVGLLLEGSKNTEDSSQSSVSGERRQKDFVGEIYTCSYWKDLPSCVGGAHS